MPQITMRVSEKIYKKLNDEAKSKNLTLTDYLLSNSIPDYLDDVLTVEMVLNRVTSLKSGEEFTLPSLFTENEWNNFKPGSRISTGRLFFQKLEKNSDNLKLQVKFLKKNSANLAIYQKL
ncbi:hypothetical protein COJ40_09110 [Bacillus cereus]|nr:hypothetical protein COJ40_09110 [Bacillus cereus]